MNPIKSLFITIGVGLLTAATASANDFTPLGTVSNNSNPDTWEQKQFDVSPLFPEITKATVSFGFKNDKQFSGGTPGLTLSDISAARHSDEFQLHFQWSGGIDTNHLRDVRLDLDGKIFRDQFGAFNDHQGQTGRLDLGTARQGSGTAINALGQTGPIAQIYLNSFSLFTEVVVPELTGNDFLKLSFDPFNETIQPDSELNFASIETAETIASIMEDKKTEGLAEIIHFEDLNAMNAAAAEESYSALLDIGKGFIEGQAGGKADFLLKALLGEKTLGDLALEIGKQGVDAVEKGAGMVITLGEFGGKITFVIYEAVQDSNEAAGRNEVWAFQKDRVREAKAEAKDVLRGRDVDNLSSMSPLARVILREMTKDQAVTILQKIAYTQKSIENSPSERDKAILATELDRLNEKASFLVNATVGKLIPGEEGWSTSS